MGKYIVKRLLWLIPILLGITFLSFAVIHLAGGDAAQQMAENSGIALSQEALEAQREALGLDRAVSGSVSGLAGGLSHGRSGDQLCVGAGCIFHLCLKASGYAAAGRHFGGADGGDLRAAGNSCGGAAEPFCRLSDPDGQLCRQQSCPTFLWALVLMYLFAIRFQVFPVISAGTGWKSLALPALTLAIAMSAKYLRQIRAAVLEELGKDYVTGARARGIPFSVTLWKSVLRCCLSTILTLLSLSIGNLLGGTAIVESIFMWDGVGKNGGGRHQYAGLSGDPGVCGSGWR